MTAVAGRKPAFTWVRLAVLLAFVVIVLIPI